MRAIRHLALILACFLAGVVVADYVLPWLTDSSQPVSADRAGVDLARVTPTP